MKKYANTDDVSEIKKMLRDQGTYIPMFVWFYNSGVSVLELQRLYFKMKTYRELLRQYNILPLETYKPKKLDALNQYELLIDIIDTAIFENNKDNFATSFFSKKYIKLLTRKSIDILWKMYDELKLNRQQIQNLIFDKLAVYKYAEEFESSLDKAYSKLTQGTWNVEYVKLELREHGIPVVYSDDSLVIARLDTFTQCNAVGPRNWCISRNSSIFSNYTSNGTQYIIYNVKKLRTDGDAIVGLTAKSRNQCVSYDQFDRTYDWKNKLHPSVLKHMKVMRNDIYVYDENLENMCRSSLISYLTHEEIDLFIKDEFDYSKYKNQASYIKNVFLNQSVLLKKNKTVDTILKDKNVNVNSVDEQSGQNTLDIAIFTRDYGNIQKIINHSSCNLSNVCKSLIKHIKRLDEKYQVDNYIIKTLICYLINKSNGLLILFKEALTNKRSDETNHLMYLINEIKPSQQLINNVLVNLKGTWRFNDYVRTMQRCGYGKNF